MTINVSHWERRDAADREAMAKNALALTQALRAADGVRSSRFYWANADTIVIMTDADAALSSTPPSADAARALFTLADMGRLTRDESWLDPSTGEQAYRAAGR
jgi:hypothetical protein